MLILGVVLLLLGWILGIWILWVVGIVFVVVGGLLLLVQVGGHREIGGRRYWY